MYVPRYLYVIYYAKCIFKDYVPSIYILGNYLLFLKKIKSNIPLNYSYYGSHYLERRRLALKLKFVIMVI